MGDGASEQYKAQLAEYLEQTMPSARTDLVGVEHFKHAGEHLGLHRRRSEKAFSFALRNAGVLGIPIHERPAEHYLPPTRLILRELVLLTHTIPEQRAPEDIMLASGAVIDAASRAEEVRLTLPAKSGAGKATVAIFCGIANFFAQSMCETP